MASMRAAALSLVIAALAGCGQRVLFRGDAPEIGSVYVIRRADGVRALRFDRPDAEDQSVYDPSRPGHEPVEYVRSALLALAYLQRQDGRLLMVGLGGGSYLRHVSLLAPGLSQEVVEISPMVVRICRRYFDCPPGAAIHVGDGRRWIQQRRRQTRRYDLVFIDAYDAKDYPRHLGTRQFFDEVRAILTTKGVVVANLSPNSNEDRADLLQTFEKVFPGAHCFVTPNDNSVALGFAGQPPTAEAVNRRVVELDRSSGGRYRLRRALERRCRIDLERARVLEDR